jgi:hypothetical protein
MTYDPMGSTVKFRRACEHLEAIREIVEIWSHETAYETVSEPDPDRSGIVHCQRFVAKIDGPPFPDISALLGDCLHNFRGVLDHLIWFASVLHKGDPPPGPKRISFPAWEVSATYKAKGLHAVSPAIKALVETLQPYHAGNDARSHPLWVLSELNNIDKHRELHAIRHVFLAPEASISNLNFGSWIEAGEYGAVQNGTVLARVFTPPSTQPADVEVNLRATHGVAIMETESTPYLHLGLILGQIRDAVHDAAKRIATAL